MTDQRIKKKVRIERKNVAMTSIDYKKAYDIILQT